MANILLIDDSDAASRTMRGLLTRANYRCEVAASPDEGWKLLREAVVIDLVVLELNFAENAGINFLQRVRDDCFWKNLPVVVYTNVGDPVRVRKALSLKVQNYLIKPYSQTAVLTEIDKAIAKRWRSLHFVETQSFCDQVGVTPEALIKLRKGLMAGLEDTVAVFPDLLARRDAAGLTHRLAKLASAAENAGVWAVADLVHEIAVQISEGRWAVLKNGIEQRDYVRRLIFSQLNPHHIPACLRTPVERGEPEEEIERLVWMQADIETYGPIIPVDEIQRQVGTLPSCPVAESAAATFRRLTETPGSTVEIAELAAQDPALCAQVLAGANRNAREAIWAVEDQESAVRLLGDVQLAALAKKLPILKERHFEVPPVTWAQFAAYQLGVAKTAQFICDYLGHTHLVANAYTAGLLHDIGKLLLVRLHPFSFRAIIGYAREKKITLSQAETKFIGCTTREMAGWFAEAHYFPEVFLDVIRWVETPEQATQNIDLVAAIAIARHMCLHARVGYNGETPAEIRPALNTIPAWAVLETRVFSSFSLRQFEAQTHSFCVRLRHEPALISKRP